MAQAQALEKQDPMDPKSDEMMQLLGTLKSSHAEAWASFSEEMD